MTPHRYLIRFAAALAVLVLAVFAFNLLVDPFGCYDVWTLRGFNQVKTRAAGRVGRSIGVLCKDYDALVFGTSRSGAGYPKRHAAWEGYRLFNFAFDGALVKEVYLALQLAHRHAPVRRVLIGLDFFMFNDTPLPPFFYRSFINPARGRPPNLLDKTLSLPSVERSLNTVRDNINPVVSGLLWEVAGGQRRQYNHYRLFQSNLRGYLNKPHFYGGNPRTPEAMAYLRRIIAMARREGMELRLAINPPHALMMEVLRHRGLWAEFEDWKRELVRAAHGAGGGPVPVFDFSGYNAVTSEEVPGPGQPETRMRWYLELTHFNHRLGAKILNRVYGLKNPAPDQPGAFGLRLTPGNIEAHLAAIRGHRKAYAAAHAKELGWVARQAR